MSRRPKDPILLGINSSNTPPPLYGSPQNPSLPSETALKQSHLYREGQFKDTVTGETRIWRPYVHRRGCLRKASPVRSQMTPKRGGIWHRHPGLI